jgi:hypothetical protein
MGDVQVALIFELLRLELLVVHVSVTGIGFTTRTRTDPSTTST